MNTTQLIQATAPTLHAKYSPNLHNWLKTQKIYRNGTPEVYRNSETGRLFIGWQHDGECFIGSELSCVLTQGPITKTWSFSRKLTDDLRHVPDFWTQYIAVGRCAMDPEHRQHFVGDETRWETIGDVRGCTWCGKATQRLRRWTETVERKAWENVEPEPGNAMLPRSNMCDDKTCTYVNIESGGSRCTTCGIEIPF